MLSAILFAVEIGSKIPLSIKIGTCKEIAMDQIQDAMVSSFANIARLMIIVMIVIAGGVILWKLLTTKLLNFIGSKCSSPRMASNLKSDDDYVNSYTPKWLFSVNEREAFYKIKNVTDKLNLILLAKVRLIDLIEPKEGIRNYIPP